MRASSSSDKKYFIGRFVSGLPSFSKKRKADKWSIQKEGLQGRQLSDALRVFSCLLNNYGCFSFCFGVFSFLMNILVLLLGEGR